MDLLAERWANPFLMLGEFIRLGQLYDFVIETLTTIAEERKTQRRWEYYLHKVPSNVPFEEYIRICEGGAQINSEDMTNEQIGTVISDSKKLLEEFK